MAKGDIVSYSVRPLRPDEKELITWFDKQETESADHLEEGGRQIIGLVTGLYAIFFGALALGAEKIEASLSRPLVIALAAVAFVFLLAALIAALFAVLPGTYRYRAASISDRKKAYDALLARKARGLTAATILFGLGLAVFAAMTLTMLFYRL